MDDNRDRIKDYICPGGPINIYRINKETGLARGTIRKLVDKYVPGTKRGKIYIDWKPIEEDIRIQIEEGHMDDDILVEKYGLVKVTLQSYRRYKMGIDRNGKDLTSENNKLPSLVNTNIEELGRKSVEVKRQNLGFSCEQMEWWLRGKGGKEYLEYMSL